MGLSPHKNICTNGTYESDKLNSFTTTDMILLKYDRTDGSIEKGVRRLFLSFALNMGPVYRIVEGPEMNF